MQFRRESVRRYLVHAPKIIPVTIERVHPETGQRLANLINVPNKIEMTVVNSSAPARYTLMSAVLPTAHQHFVSLLRNRYTYGYKDIPTVWYEIETV